MILGMILGPVTGLVRPEMFGDAGQIFTTLALIVVLFQSGMEFKILSLRGAIGPRFFADDGGFWADYAGPFPGFRIYCCGYRKFML